MDDIVAEARRAVRLGVKEIVLVAQESTAYGRDLASSSTLADLLHRLAEIAPDIWIRVMYAHPESIDARTIAAVAEHDNICPYFDLPIQHAADGVLKRMGRNYTRRDLRNLFNAIRRQVPQAVLRTTMIVGFPGETERDFLELAAFIQEMRFDHLGVFVYSGARDLPAAAYAGQVAKKTACARFDRLMSLQKELSAQINRRYIRRVIPVLIEKEVGQNMCVGRTFFQAPEVDGITWVKGKGLAAGQFSRVHISDATEYDLVGEAA
jgi:ribosomal protein S12 methylthiotransferase